MPLTLVMPSSLVASIRNLTEGAGVYCKHLGQINICRQFFVRRLRPPASAAPALQASLPNGRPCRPCKKGPETLIELSNTIYTHSASKQFQTPAASAQGRHHFGLVPCQILKYQELQPSLRSPPRMHPKRWPMRMPAASGTVGAGRPRGQALSE